MPARTAIGSAPRTRRRRVARRCRWAAPAAQPVGDRDEHGVAGRVPERVVDGLEVIEVHREQRARCAGVRRCSRIASCNVTRLASPVRASKCASWRNCRSAAISAVASTSTPRHPSTCCVVVGHRLGAHLPPLLAARRGRPARSRCGTAVPWRTSPAPGRPCRGCARRACRQRRPRTASTSTPSNSPRRGDACARTTRRASSPTAPRPRVPGNRASSIVTMRRCRSASRSDRNSASDLRPTAIAPAAQVKA